MRIEQSELRDAARQLMDGIGPTASGEDAWTAIRDAGFLGISVPEALGGLEQPLSAACWLHMELGRALSPAPLLPGLLAADALTACPQSGERDAWLARIVGGDAPAVSLLDPAAADLRLTGASLDGKAAAMSGPEGATHALVALADPPLLALIPLDHKGVQRVAHATWDQSRTLFDLVLTNVPLEDILVIARGAKAQAAIDALSLHLHFGIAADSIGAAEEILIRTVAYLQDRRQFDRPLAMFQALKHRCADLKVAIATAEALLMDQLNLLDEGTGDDPLIMAKGAKAIGSSTFRTVAEEAVQLHGGMGMTWEHPCHLFLKRALLNEHLASEDDACDLAVADHMLAANA